MRKKIVFFSFFIITLIYASCSGDISQGESNSVSKIENTKDANNENSTSYDPTRGEGRFDSTNLKIEGLNTSMANKGKSIAETKCVSCHKTSEEKLVGPGWKGVTHRRNPYWIMNFITDPDPMIDKDPEVQAQLELCLVRMPNQNLVDEEARNILEFMRQNDGDK